MLAAVACGGNASPPSGPIALDPTTRPPTATAKPSAKPTPKKTPSTKPPAAPTTSPPPSGGTVGTAGAFLKIAPPEPPRTVAAGTDCGKVFPEISGARCGTLTLDGGSALWVTGRTEGAVVVRLLTQDKTGYVTRYTGSEPPAGWLDVDAFAAPLTGHGTDGLVVVVRTHDGAASYDVLTWVKGGPLVLRAHRGPLSDGRVVAKAGTIQEYALVPDGRYARRTLAWDGRYFRLSARTGVPAESAPPR